MFTRTAALMSLSFCELTQMPCGRRSQSRSSPLKQRQSPGLDRRIHKHSCLGSVEGKQLGHRHG